MGWEMESWRVTAHLDAHAGDQEREDAKLWTELCARLDAVAGDPRYARILPHFEPGDLNT